MTFLRQKCVFVKNLKIIFLKSVFFYSEVGFPLINSFLKLVFICCYSLVPEYRGKQGLRLMLDHNIKGANLSSQTTENNISLAYPTLENNFPFLSPSVPFFPICVFVCLSVRHIFDPPTYVRLCGFVRSSVCHVFDPPQKSMRSVLIL